MAGDYIRRDDALEITTRTCGDYAAAFAEIRKLPAADVAEVVLGQWEGEGDGYADGEIVLDVWHCSQCGYCIDDGTDNQDCLPKYCPNCGAKMDGGIDDAAD
nr:MAG TPA: DNA-directed RNA polymerase [Bacteriophage sp.]